MRFYIGFSRRLPLKWIGLALLALLAFFGIGNINAIALISNNGAESVRTCSYNGLFTDSNCVLQTSMRCETGYGLANCYAATTTNSTMAQKTTWYHFVTNTNNSNCTTSQYVSFNASVILNQNISLNGSNANNWFDPNALNYPVWQTTPTTRNSNLKSVKENVNTRALYSGYWPYLADWTGTQDQNRNGVRLYWKTPQNTFGNSYCNFLSYGSNNLTLNYSCTAPAKMTYYQLGINQYNNAGGLASSGIYTEASLKISSVSDPCASGSSGGSTDNSDIIESINDSTQNVTNSISQQTDEILGGMEDLGDKQDLTNDKLDDINDKLDGLGGNPSSSGYIGDLEDGTGGGHFSDILYAPIRLLEAIKGDEPDPSIPLARSGSNQCTGLSLPITMGSHSETVVVPCGDGFWAEWPWQIVLLYQTIVFGYLGYRILLYLVKYFNDLANPHDLNEISDFTIKHF